MEDSQVVVEPEDVLSVGGYPLIYVFSIPDSPAHEGRLKIGDTTLHTDKSVEEVTREDLEAAARKRIDSYTKTADVSYNLEHVELALYDKSAGRVEPSFRDYRVHDVLVRSGHAKTFARKDKSSGEWFEIPLSVAVDAIKKTKAGQDFVTVDSSIPVIKLRSEQELAINETVKHFTEGTVESPKRVLWNAKMRFGKTLTAYSLLRRLEEEDFKKVLVITHYPSVNKSWTDDFRVSGLQAEGWRYGSKHNNNRFQETASSDKYVWFASIQALRGSYSDESIDDADFERLKRNEEIFAQDWDLIITDEVHQGTLTQLAKRMFMGLRARYYLDLSGTPFNVMKAESWEDEGLAERFAYDYTYHWAYPDERLAKAEFTKNHPLEPNPYAGLPEIRFVTYDVSDAIKSLREDDVTGKLASISFSTLFATSRTGEGEFEFVQESEVTRLLNKMRGGAEFSNDPDLFPYSKTYKNYFKHTLWMLPNVSACMAMERLLNNSDSGFAGYKIINATGAGAGSSSNALEEVHNAIKHGDDRPSITVSYDMLTTGVTVPEWTAVFMLNNTTSPMKYMQTAFRAASPGMLPDGRVKETSFVFDFNPDRCLAEIVEIAKANAQKKDKSGKELDPVEQEQADRKSVNEYLEHMSLISMQGAKFVKPDSDAIMESLNEAYINEVVEQGFSSPRLWNSDTLQTFDISKTNLVNKLRELQGGKSMDGKSLQEVKISEVTDEDEARLAKINEKEKSALTPDELEEKTELEKRLDQAKKEERKNRKNAENILVGIAARLPMLVFASPAETKIEPGNFAHLIDEESWLEFMPPNLKRLRPEGILRFEARLEAFENDEISEAEAKVLYWDDVSQFFNQEIFSRASERIRSLARHADSKPPLERAVRIANLFSYFKNPGKETVLTPYRVVDLQYTNTLGGLSFLDQSASDSVITFVRLVEKETGDKVSHPIARAVMMLDDETHELDPTWFTSTVDPVENDDKDFWEDPNLSVFDINSKTSLYPLFAACSKFYAEKQKLPGGLLGRRVENPYEEFIEDEELASDKLLWKNVVEWHVYVNSRVAYSNKIAQRVLGGYDDSVTVNASVVDVIEIRNKLKDLGLYRRPPQQGKRTEEKFSKVLQKFEDNDPKVVESAWRWIFNSDWNFEVIVDGKMIESSPMERAKMVMGVSSVEELKELVGDTSEHEKFTAVVGNPPYQENIGTESSNAKAYPIWQYFLYVSLSISENVSIVSPARWRGGLTKAEAEIKKELINRQEQIHSFVYYDPSEHLFPGTLIRDGVGVLFFDSNQEDRLPLVSENNSPMYTKDLSESFYNPLAIKIFNQSKLNHVVFLSTYGKGKISDPRHRIREFTKRASDVKTEVNSCRMLGVYGGLGSSVTWKWVDPNAFNVAKKEYWESYKVGGWVLSPEFSNPTKLYILKPLEAFGEKGRFVLFDTEDEAKNFKSYMTTCLIKFQLKATQHGRGLSTDELLPDLEDYTSNNPLFKSNDELGPEHEYYGLTLDQRLYKLFNLTDEEIVVVES